ncbi:MAG: hypothetical protein M1283_06280 [Gammaproteobacteria bacterium]|nr:hypothetical protein [Gammaproteobacteria bacterium]
MIYVLHASLALTAFLVVLNGFLHGTYKAHIGVFLSIFLVGLLVASFVAFGWKAGILALVLSFIYGIASRSLAARLAARLLSGPGSPSRHYVGLPTLALERISYNLGPNPKFDPYDLENIMHQMRSRSSQQSERALVALLDYCDSNPDVQKVMTEFKATHETLIELYNNLLMAGAGQWAGGHYVPASALAYPHTLRYLLEHLGCGRDTLWQRAAHLVIHFETGSPLK